MDEDVFYTPDHQTSTWIIDQFTCRIQTSDPKITEQIRSWSFATLVGWCMKEHTRIFLIPRKKWKWTLKILGIQAPNKKPKRIAHAIQLGRQSQIKGAVGHSRKKIKGHYSKDF